MAQAGTEDTAKEVAVEVAVVVMVKEVEAALAKEAVVAMVKEVVAIKEELKGEVKVEENGETLEGAHGVTAETLVRIPVEVQEVDLGDRLEVLKEVDLGEHQAPAERADSHPDGVIQGALGSLVETLGMQDLKEVDLGDQDGVTQGEGREVIPEEIWVEEMILSHSEYEGMLIA